MRPIMFQGCTWSCSACSARRSTGLLAMSAPCWERASLSHWVAALRLPSASAGSMIWPQLAGHGASWQCAAPSAGAGLSAASLSLLTMGVLKAACQTLSSIIIMSK